MEQPAAFWVPSIAPSGLMIYNGDKFPEWRGNVFAGGLSAQHQRLSRVTLEGTTVTGREPLLAGEYRIRDVREGPDGYIYIATDNRVGLPTPIIRLEPVAD
jgi:glucose/arabinose dehydrogenase